LPRFAFPRHFSRPFRLHQLAASQFVLCRHDQIAPIFLGKLDQLSDAFQIAGSVQNISMNPLIQARLQLPMKLAKGFRHFIAFGSETFFLQRAKDVG
jgi:hypothetical protein